MNLTVHPWQFRLVLVVLVVGAISCIWQFRYRRSLKKRVNVVNLIHNKQPWNTRSRLRLVLFFFYMEFYEAIAKIVWIVRTFFFILVDGIAGHVRSWNTRLRRVLFFFYTEFYEAIANIVWIVFFFILVDEITCRVRYLITWHSVPSIQGESWNLCFPLMQILAPIRVQSWNLRFLLMILRYMLTHKLSIILKSKKGGYRAHLFFTHNSEKVTFFISAPVFRSLLVTLIILICIIVLGGLILYIFLQFENEGEN